MRIIAGMWKRRKIEAPSGLSTRPPGDFIRESVFSIIRDQLEDASVLDLFAGSGSFGLEALSRGASRCLFVENDARAISSLWKNIKSLNAEEKVMVNRGNAFRAVENQTRRGARFEIIFCDPPFAMGESKSKRKPVIDMIETILTAPLVTDEGVFILRTRKDDKYQDDFLHSPYDTRVYGQSRVYFFKQ